MLHSERTVYTVLYALTFAWVHMGVIERNRIMGRPDDYSAREDTIILETAGQPISLTNKLLTDAGFESRSKNAISGRRLLLRRRSEENSGDMDTATLFKRREALRRAYDETRAELALVEQALTERLTEEQRSSREMLEELSGGK